MTHATDRQNSTVAILLCICFYGSAFLPMGATLMGLGEGYWENQQEVQVNTTRIAKISAKPKHGSNHKYFAGERQVQENPELTQRPSNIPMQNTTSGCKRIIQLNECM
jgi:hypothetical protein